MSGIANSTQPVAMTARGYDKERLEWLKNAKCSADVGRTKALDHHRNCKEQKHVFKVRAKPPHNVSTVRGV